MRTNGLLLVAALVLTGACVEQNPNTPNESDIETARKQHVLSSVPGTLKHPVNAELEGKLIYLGCDVDVAKPRKGQTFTLTHYWKVIQPVSEANVRYPGLAPQIVKDSQPLRTLGHGPLIDRFGKQRRQRLVDPLQLARTENQAF